MTARHITATLLSTLSLAACGDDTTIITTSPFGWTVGNTFVTHNGGDEEAMTMPSPTEAWGSTGEMAQTTGDATLSGSSTSEPVGPTTSGDDTTGPSAEEPFTDPPFGCGVITEVIFNVPTADRHVVVDISACTRPQVLTFETFTFKDKQTFSVDVPVVGTCPAMGGPASAVDPDPGFSVVTFADDAADMSSFSLALFVDGVQTDNVRVTAILSGQEWANMPDAPDEPMRRAEDFSWRVLPQHVPGCELLKP